MHLLPEKRVDPILGHKVIISPLRATRPRDMKVKVYTKRRLAKHDKKCPFCVGNEYMLPGIVSENINKKRKIWVRTVKNKYFATSPFANQSYGYHEVIIETPNHNEHFHDLNKVQIKAILDEICNRISVLNKDPRIKYVNVFKNYGSEGGASLMHAHSQIVAMDFVPDAITKYIKAYKKDKHILAKYAKKEKKIGKRFVTETKYFYLICPYASRFHYELWFIPKQIKTNITKLNNEEKEDLAVLLKTYIKKLFKLGDISYNLLYINAPIKYKGNFHFFIILAPRMAKFAGFEFSTGVTINSQPPEYSAEFYKL